MTFRRALAAALLLVAACADAPPPAEKAAPPATGAAPDRLARIQLPADTVERIALANVMHVLYHELSHALIHQFDIPMLAREEDAADNLATLLFLADKSPIGRSALVAVAMGWLDAHRDGTPDSSDYADEHALHIQRFFQIVCMLYGSDPEAGAATADEAGLPAERREPCVYEYGQIQSGWSRVLQPHRAVAGAPPGGRVAVTWQGGPASSSPAVEMLRRSLAIEVIAEDVERRLRLPHDLTIALRACDEDNAWWDAEERAVTVCYELVEEYALMAARIAAGPRSLR